MPSNLDATDIAYATENGLAVFDHVSLSLSAGELLVIAGRSGSGRTTLLEALAGLRRPSEGTVKWDGVDIHSLGQDALFAARQRVGCMFQVHALISNMSVFDNIALPLRYHTDMSDVDIGIVVEGRLRQLGLTGVARSFPESLSVREQKCAAFLRAFVMDPDLVFLDEPTAGLDDVSEREIINLLLETRTRRQVTTVLITNETRTMEALAGRLAVLNGGRVTLHEPGSLNSESIVQLLEGAYEQTRT